MKFCSSSSLARRGRSYAVLLGAAVLFLSTAILTRAQTAVTAQPLPYGPVHRYSFGSHAAGAGAAGDVLLDSVGVAHAVLRGSGASYSSAGVSLTGGSSSTAAYLDLPNGIISGSATSYPGYTGASYEFWVTVLSNLNSSRVFDFGTGTTGELAAPGGAQTGTDYLMLTASAGTNGTVQFERSNRMPGGGQVVAANANSLGSEMHLVVVYDNTVGAWKWYKNGVLQSQFTSLLGPDTLLDNNNWLGRSQFAADSNSNVVYHEFRIYDYALNDNQVSGNYLAGPDTLTSPAGNSAPFAWYRLGDTVGSSSAADSSGGGNPGTLVTGAGFVSGGLTSATALGLTGGYVRIPNSVALVNPTDAITVAAWIDPTDWNGNRRIVQKGTTNNQYRLTAESGVLKFELANPTRTVTAALPAANTWSHVAATYDGATLRLYVNGTPLAATTATGSIATSTDDLFIGSYSTTAASTEKFSGLMDDVRLYNRALGAAEINVLATGVLVAAPASASTVQEGVGASGAITVTRTGNPSAALPVSLSQATTAGQAALGTRFTLSPSNLNLTIPAGQSSVSVTVSPLADKAIRGTELVTLTAAPGANYFVNGSGSATVQILDTPINVWKIARFGSISNAQTLGGDNADPDNDGLSNLLEYALNADPQKFDATGLTASGVESNKLTFTYNRLKNAPDIVYRVQWSPDLATWTEPAVTETILSDDGTVQRVKATFPGDGVSTRGFAKLKVVRN